MTNKKVTIDEAKTEDVNSFFLSEKEKRKLIRKEKRLLGIKNLLSKIFSSLFSIIIGLWLIICLFDFLQVQGRNKPIFCLKNETLLLSNGSIEKCTGLGYKVLKFDKLNNCDVKIIYGAFWIEDKCPETK